MEGKIMKSNSLLKNKPYVYLISSQVVSSVGDWLDLLALFALVALKWNASPMEMTYLMLCFTVPMIVFGVFAGVLADRYDRKKIMIISDIIRAVVVVGVVFSSSIWVVYLLIFVKSSFGALFSPAKNGVIKEVVPDQQMQQAVAISAMIDNGSKIVGPMISGLLVASAGVYWAFYLDAGSFLLSALLLLGVRSRVLIHSEKAEESSRENQSFFKGVKEGFVFMKTVPIIFSGLMVLSLVLLVLQIADTQIMILLREIKGAPIELAGYSMAASGAGMFIMSAILSKKEIRSVIYYLSFGAIVIGAGFASTVLIMDLPVVLLKIIYPIIFFLVGIAAGGVFVPFNVCAQKNTPVHMSGRVFGTINSVTTGAAIVGMIIGGVLVETFGIKTTFILASSILVLMGMVVAIVKPLIERSGTVAESEQGVQREA
jgi:MFS family permease